jgi:hypothetical protein
MKILIDRAGDSKSRIVAVFFLLVAIFAFAGCENKMHTQRGSVAGLVLDSEGNAVSKAMVTSHRSLFKAETDEKGYYTFTSLDVGSHRLTVERNGYFLASRTIELAYGQVLEGVNIKVEPLGQMISFAVIKKETRSATIEVVCLEPMSVLAGWRERSSARLQTMPTEIAARHFITLTGLFPGSDYLFEIEGTTADGRRFKSEQGSFRTVSLDDVYGAPEPVGSFKVTQSDGGPLLSWDYTGIDPLSGFRIFRSNNGLQQEMIQDESMIFAAQTWFVDEAAVPGRLYGYSLQSVDLEGNVSSMSEIIKIVPAGKIQEDITWSWQLSPVFVSGDLVVPAGRTLRIEPGVTVTFAAEDAGRSGFSPLVCEMIIEGTLIAEGEADMPIRLTSSASLPGRTDWDGIRIVAANNQTPSVLRHVLVAGAEDGVALYDSAAVIEDFTARYCFNGFSLNGASGTSLLRMTFEDCDTAFNAESSWNCSAEDMTIRGGRVGVSLAGNTDFVLRRFDARDVRETAVRVVDRARPVLRNGLIQSLRNGLIIGGASGDFQFLTVDAAAGIIVDGADVPVIRNCIIINRQNPDTGYGIEDKTLGRSYPYNNIFGFLQATRNCDQLGASVINADPVFVGAGSTGYDYHLKSSSPLITAAENGGQPGAYGSDL